MQTIAHLSGLLVGWTSPSVLSALADTLHRLQPDVVAVSGNLTASGSASEMRAARAFLESAPSPQVVVPGERDYSALRRIFRPLSSQDAFAKHVETNPAPFFANRHVVLMGINTARMAEGKRFAMSETERAQMKKLLETAEPSALKILVSYAPVFVGDRFDPRPEDGRVFRSQFDVVLTGTGQEKQARPVRPSDTSIFVPCTARAEGLAFNVLRVRPGESVLERYGWRISNADFRLLSSEPLLTHPAEVEAS